MKPTIKYEIHVGEEVANNEAHAPITNPIPHPISTMELFLMIVAMIKMVVK